MCRRKRKRSATFARPGLAGVRFKKLNDSSYFVVGPAKVRETKIEGTKSTSAAENEAASAIPVLYKGPMRGSSDDFGFTYRRGKRTLATPAAIAALRASRLADQFTIFDDG